MFLPLMSSMILLWSENTLCMISIILNLFELVLGPMVYLGVCFIGAYKSVFCFYWVVCSINTEQVLFIDSVVEFAYILANFLSHFINWSESTEVSDFNYGFVCFSFPLYQFLLHIFLHICVVHKYLGCFIFLVN